MPKRKLRKVVIVIQAESADSLTEIEKFVRQAIRDSDEGAAIIRDIEVTELKGDYEIQT